MLTEIIVLSEENSAMKIMHMVKAAIGLTTLFLGFQFGRDIATKVLTSTTSTPAAS
jgi:hypothetical protein